ncbi:hypothetical protein HYY75_04820, partial [bacterium]|nr:hypothetical protein [bacterium]
YREADISPSFFIFLIVFTAMLIGDGGYALVCLFACLVSYKFITRKGIPPKFLDLFIILFIGTLVFGVFTNTYFGFQPSITKFFMWVDPNSEVGATLLKRFCFYLGAVHLSVGRIWKIKRNPITLSTLSEVGWIIFTWAMLDLVNVLVLSDLGPARMVPMFIVSLILVIFFTAPSWNPISCIGQGIGAVALSAASFLSDIISYIRLWAVGYAGGMLASSFNDLARIAPFAIGVLILILGHGVNIILGLVAIFVHGVRLNLLEFSNHIGMEWSGRNYDPFRKS